jgi:hypothetical protein
METLGAPTNAPPRSLERSAVDAVARADYGSALKCYQELSKIQPDRSVFRESARIIAEKMIPVDR